MAPTPALPDTGLTSSNRETAAPVNQTIQRSRSWKKKLQQHVYSWKRQNGTENASLGMPSVDHSSPKPQSAQRLPGSNDRRHNAKSSPNQIPSIQSASLDSLTSASLFSRNSFPSVISTGTDATSVSDDFTACGITCPVDSSSVKPYKRMKNNLIVYLAHDDIEIPLDVVEQWETTDLDRLKTDLSEVVMKIYRKGVERESRRARSTLYPSSGPHEYDISFELRMSGRATRDAHFVAIVPSIWLVCGSTWACKEVRAAMEEITWPTLPVEIHEGRVPIPSVADGQVDISKLDLTNGYHLGDGITLYIHVEDLITETTSCGLLCCATIKDGDTYSHHFSRIGGLVTNTNTLTSSQFGVSTAHGMLDHPWWHRQFQEKNSVPTWDCESIESTDSEDDYEFDSESLYEDQESLYVEPSTDSFSLSDNVVGEGYRDPQLVPRWRNVSHHGVLSFLGASILKENNLQHLMGLHDDTVTQTDHAMIPLEWPQDTSFQPWKNRYFPSTLPDKPIDITTHMGNGKLTEGAVSIICQANSSINGHLLPGSACLAMGGRMFTLRKLKTVTPLARGVSGSWVARGTELCGMILAVSNPEPYAYMMRAEDLISNLEASSPSIETVEIFSSHSRKAMHRASGALPRRWSSSRSHRRSVTATMSPRISIDDPRSITTIKRSLSTRISGLGGSSRRYDFTAKDVLRGKSIPRRTRSVRGLLSDIFSTKLEEIAQPSDTKCADIKQAPEVRRPSPASYRPHSYHPVQVKRRALTGKKLILKTPLEPISEVSSLVGLGIDSVPETNNVLLQSTLCSLTTTFRHGHIRLRKSDLIRVETLDVNAGLDLPECLEYNIALDKTVRLWHSGNYETQHEEEVDEIGDLVDWWDSWGKDVGGLITEQDEEPHRPNSVMSDDFPGVSYSDTTSEDSYPSWPSRPASAAEGSFIQYSDEYELDDIKPDELSGGDDSGLGLGVIGESGSDRNCKGTPREIYGGHCVPGIMASR